MALRAPPCVLPLRAAAAARPSALRAAAPARAAPPAPLARGAAFLGASAPLAARRVAAARGVALTVVASGSQNVRIDIQGRHLEVRRVPTAGEK
jgi:hypothetical protein